MLALFDGASPFVLLQISDCALPFSHCILFWCICFTLFRSSIVMNFSRIGCDAQLNLNMARNSNLSRFKIGYYKLLTIGLFLQWLAAVLVHRLHCSVFIDCVTLDDSCDGFTHHTHVQVRKSFCFFGF
eukprot:177839_1